MTSSLGLRAWSRLQAGRGVLVFYRPRRRHASEQNNTGPLIVFSLSWHSLDWKILLCDTPWWNTDKHKSSLMRPIRQLQPHITSSTYTLHSVCDNQSLDLLWFRSEALTTSFLDYIQKYSSCFTVPSILRAGKFLYHSTIIETPACSWLLTTIKKYNKTDCVKFL